MKRKQPQDPVIYKHQELMNEFNQMMIRIKLHLFYEVDASECIYDPKLTVEELDELTNKIMIILKQDKESHIKY